MGSLAVRPLTRSDFPLMQRWLGEPHVQRWWNQPLDLPGVKKKYAPRVAGIEPTHMFIIAHDEIPIGFIQWHRWADYPEHAARLGVEAQAAGLDLAIGDPLMIGRGLGPQVIRDFSLGVIARAPGITAIVTDPEVLNTRSVRAFEKAGFCAVRTIQVAGEHVQRRLMRLALAGEGS